MDTYGHNKTHTRANICRQRESESEGYRGSPSKSASVSEFALSHPGWFLLSLERKEKDKCSWRDQFRLIGTTVRQI